MSMISEVFRIGGIWMYLILGLTLLSLLGIGVLGVMGARGKRAPAAAWWIGPVLIFILGCAGAAVGLGEAMEAVEMASPENRKMLVARGFALAINTLGFAAIVNTFLCGFVALGIGASSALGTRDGAGWRFGGPVAVALMVIPGALALSGWIVSERNIDSTALLIPAALFWAGLGCVLAGLRSTTDEERAAEIAADRYIAGFAAVFSAASATIFVLAAGLVDVLYSLEMASPEDRRERFEFGVELVAQSGWVGLVAMVIAAVAAGILVLAAGKRAFGRRALVDLAICIVAFLPALAALGFFVVRVSAFAPVFDKTILEAKASQVGEAPSVVCEAEGSAAFLPDSGEVPSVVCEAEGSAA